MKEIDLMIFDFDGTLVSSGRDLALAINYTLGELNLPLQQESAIINYVGDGIKLLIERSLGAANFRHREEALVIFTEYYSKHLLDNTALIPGVEEVLVKYQDKLKVIMTNKRYVFTAAIAQGLKIDKYFKEIMGGDFASYMKPDRRLVDYLIEKYSVAREKTVIIGDGVNDINVAKNSGILCCAYLNGLGKKKELQEAAADFYCENLREISSLFC